MEWRRVYTLIHYFVNIIITLQIIRVFFFLSLQLCYVLKAVIILESVNVSCVPFVIVRKKQCGFGDVFV